VNRQAQKPAGAAEADLLRGRRMCAASTAAWTRARWSLGRATRRSPAPARDSLCPLLLWTWTGYSAWAGGLGRVGLGTGNDDQSAQRLPHQQTTPLARLGTLTPLGEVKSNRSTCTLLGLIGLSRTRCQPHGANETSTRLLNLLALTPFPMSISAKRSVHELMKVTKKTKMLLPKGALEIEDLKGQVIPCTKC
jgi:hypothetical protein